MNRVKNKNEPKRPQSVGRLRSFWFSTRPTARGGTDYNAPPLAEGRVENQNEPKRPPLVVRTQTATTRGRLGSFWFSTRFTR